MDAALVDRLARARPAVVRLAETVCLAALVDPALLRAARLRFVPESDAGLEADLWFSPLVRNRSPDGFVFLPDAADLLRGRLAADPARVAAAWELTESMHRHLPPAVRLEEEIAWLTARGDAPERVEALLRSALATLVAGGRRGLAGWAARALPALPAAARGTATVRMLEAAARLRLARDPVAAGLARHAMPEWTPWVLPADLPRVDVGVILRATELQLDAAGAGATHVVRVPATDPLLVEVSWPDPDTPGAEHVQTVTLRRGEIVRLPVPVPDVSLRTLAGEAYDLRAAEMPARALRADLLPYEDDLARHRYFLAQGREEAERALLDALGPGGEARPGEWIVVRGAAGVGTSTMLARMVDLAPGRAVACHFFRRGDPRYGDVGAGERSLAAQVAAAGSLPAAPLAAAHPLRAALGQLEPGQGSSLIVVIDGIQDAHGHDGDAADALLDMLPDPLPAGVRVLVSLREPSEGGWDRLLRGAASVVDVEPSPALVAACLEQRWQVAVERFPGAVEAAGGNPGVAEVLAEWIRVHGWREERGDFLASRWDDLTRRHPGAADGLGLLAAARAPIPTSEVDGALRDAFDDDVRAGEPFFVVRDGGSPAATVELRSAVVRAFVAGRLGPGGMAACHRRLAEITTGAYLDGAVGEDAREYAVRWGVGHWLEAREPERAAELVTRARFLEDALRVAGVDSVLRDLARVDRAFRPALETFSAGQYARAYDATEIA